ncbi:phosphotransferase family protein [Rhodococcus spelaei]|uniref:Phosphotransferase family protein n=1 Tax=Rhodococcus spelaei TaxID=2546320 RepID=A0A541B9Z2_9NOCA|nr:phosphotransferase family protein [Rhodococcus spelaei]TQF69150.1 phosphotransferase family protein [Rhodococcus spelaei]
MSTTGTAPDNAAEIARPTDSKRDPEQLRHALQVWLAGRLHDGADPTVSGVRLPDANGISSETILFDATWTESAEDALPGAEPAQRTESTAEDGRRRAHELVARVEPTAVSMPVFPSYDMDTQFAVMKGVGELSDVPVPTAYWSESDPTALGAPFFVMERIEGTVPPDVMPYNFGSWVSEATPEQRRTLQDASVDVLARLHAVPDPQQHFGFLRLHDAGPSAEQSLRAHLARQRGFYEWAAADGPRSPLIERCLDRLEATVPADDSPAVLCWGDSRIGNIMYRDFEPVAVLDWEMAALGPREMDLAWMIFLHRFFEDLATLAGLPGLPDFMRREDMAARYTELTGHKCENLDYYSLYAALRHATIMFRVQARAIAFGQAQQPADPDDMILHRPTLEAMLDGTYWSRVP